MRQIFLDVETTGFSPAMDRVVEVAAHSYIDGWQEDGGAFHRYCNPQRDISEGAQRVHGLTPSFLSDKPLFESFAEDLQAFLRGGEVIIHNASFDVGFLDMEFSKCGLLPLADIAQVTCSLKLSRLKNTSIQKHTLTDLCRHFGIDDSVRVQHSASLDVQLLAQVYFAMTRD